MEGVHPKLVQALLGHASIEMTVDTYPHVVPEMGGAAARAMDTVLEDHPEDGGPNLVPLGEPELEEEPPSVGAEAFEG